MGRGGDGVGRGEGRFGRGGGGEGGRGRAEEGLGREMEVKWAPQRSVRMHRVLSRSFRGVPRSVVSLGVPRRSSTLVEDLVGNIYHECTRIPWRDSGSSKRSQEACTCIQSRYFFWSNLHPWHRQNPLRQSSRPRQLSMSPSRSPGPHLQKSVRWRHKSGERLAHQSTSHR